MAKRVWRAKERHVQGMTKVRKWKIGRLAIQAKTEKKKEGKDYSKAQGALGRTTM